MDSSYSDGSSSGCSSYITASPGSPPWITRSHSPRRRRASPRAGRRSPWSCPRPVGYGRPHARLEARRQLFGDWVGNEHAEQDALPLPDFVQLEPFPDIVAPAELARYMEDSGFNDREDLYIPWERSDRLEASLEPNIPAQYEGPVRQEAGPQWEIAEYACFTENVPNRDESAYSSIHECENMIEHPEDDEQHENWRLNLRLDRMEQEWRRRRAEGNREAANLIHQRAHQALRENRALDMDCTYDLPEPMVPHPEYEDGARYEPREDQWDEMEFVGDPVGYSTPVKSRSTRCAASYTPHSPCRLPSPRSPY